MPKFGRGTRLFQLSPVPHLRLPESRVSYWNTAVLFALLLAAPAPQDGPITTLTLQTRVVSIAAYVRDKQGRPVGGLTPADFTLKQDGNPQEIRYFSQGSDLPLTLALMVDVSASQQQYMPDETAASMVFFRSMLQRKEDRASLTRFAAAVEELQPMTANVDHLQRALGYLDYKPAAGPAGTLLFDAVVAEAQKLAPQQGRKAMVLLTDGGDNGSKATLAQAVAAAQKADVVVYSVFYSSDADKHSGSFLPRYQGDRGALEQLAEQTGGHVFDSGPRYPLRETFSLIQQQLRLEYLLGYRPADAPLGSYHKLELKAKDSKLVVEARRGFFAR